MNRRVVITGRGLATASGSSIESFWTNLLSGHCGLARTKRLNDPRFRTKVCAEISNLPPLPPEVSPQQSKRIDRYGHLSLCVAGQALREAGLSPGCDIDPARIGISFGTALGGVSNAEGELNRFNASSRNRISPYLALQVFGGAAHSNIAIAFGIQGYATTNSNSCASGTVAIGEGARAIADGKVDAVVAGGAEAPLYPLTFGAFDVIRSMSASSVPDQACKPFDRNRDGFVMGEGAAAVVLESMEHARARGARPLAEVVGYSLNNDAHHMTQSRPDASTVIRAMRDALNDATLIPDAIDLINTHGTGTPINDRTESAAIARAFSWHRPMVHSTKGYYGHPLGASGAIEAVVATLVLQNQITPPTLGCHEPEFENEIDLVLAESSQKQVRTVLSNSFGFGGINSLRDFQTSR
jgi:3-oxoacyl-[acyl-carrier-protein] synthase II